MESDDNVVYKQTAAGQFFEILFYEVPDDPIHDQQGQQNNDVVHQNGNYQQLIGNQMNLDQEMNN